MTQPIERHEHVFPRWFTVLVMLAWVGVMAWAISYSTVTLT